MRKIELSTLLNEIFAPADFLFELNWFFYQPVLLTNNYLL